MFSRLPPAEVSARWRRTRFSYYTLHPAGNDYAHIVREIHGFETDSKQISPVLGQFGRRKSHIAEVLLDVGSLADDSGYLELGVTLVSPDEDLLAYSVDTDRRRGLRAPLPRPRAPATDLAEVVPRSYYGGAWSADSQWFFYTVHDEAYRPHEVWRHRIGTPVDRRRAGADGAGRAVRPERPRPAGPATSCCCSARAATPARSGSSTRTPPSRRRGRSAAAGRASSTAPSTPRGPTAADLLLVTNDDAVEFRLMRCPVPRDADQDHTAWTEVAAGGPGRAAGARRRLRRARAC